MAVDIQRQVSPPRYRKRVKESSVWLYAKHRLFDGLRAINLIHEGRADEVLAIIESLDEGAYT